MFFITRLTPLINDDAGYKAVYHPTSLAIKKLGSAADNLSALNTCLERAAEYESGGGVGPVLRNIKTSHLPVFF